MTLSLPTILFIIALVVVIYMAFQQFRTTGGVQTATIALLLITIGLVLLGLGLLSDPLISG